MQPAGIPKKMGKQKKVSDMGPKELEMYKQKLARHRAAVTEAALERLAIREFVDPLAPGGSTN